MIDKPAIYALYKKAIGEKIRLLQSSLDELKEIGKNETKSTAGDKHETALAMVQLEQEKKRIQLREVQQQLADFEKIDPGKTAFNVGRGSLVVTSKGLFYLSLALGKIVIDGKPIIAISPQSPLGQQLMGRTSGDTIIVHSVGYTIESVH
ncbi:hypothetical protein [Flavihumibacter fluvii]|uniref:hypothetical protein n=1 Tax=Flavihumibacter fluvii TaxID=2838157 RepID=UPI001BDDF58B|nr:hypothetical protein [Flavihumibacter fluvii]ULQ53452.1 hypothetical protein KJS93_03850 [Flavihumibacter fluvii]